MQRAISKLEKQIRIALLRPEVPSTIGDVAEAPAPPATEARSSVPALVRIENGSALGLVNDLDSIASSVFSKISTLDLHVAAEHLRLQSLTPLGWLPVHQSPAVSDDHITVSDFTLALGQALMDPSTEGSESALLKRLPMSLRFAFRCGRRLSSYSTDPSNLTSSFASPCLQISVLGEGLAYRSDHRPFDLGVAPSLPLRTPARGTRDLPLSIR